MTMPDFTPEIIAFCCRHCAYAAADLAGSLRVQYPPNVKIVEVPCTGRVEIVEVLHAFERGVGGVLVAGCLEGDCHYLVGNVAAKRRVKRISGLLDEIGLGGERIAMFNLSSAMGARLAEIAAQMTRQIMELGPNPLGQRRGAGQAGSEKV